jgi:hypothetical protein
MTAVAFERVSAAGKENKEVSSAGSVAFPPTSDTAQKRTDRTALVARSP